MWTRFKCWLGWHDYVFIRFTDFYDGDLGYELKCLNCKKKKFDDGIPLM